MARAPKPLDGVDLMIAEVLQEHLDRSGMSRNQVAIRAGIGNNRAGRIFRKEGPGTTVGEVQRLASALGLRGSDVLAEVERRIAAEAGRDEAPATPAPASSTGYRTRWAGVRELPRVGPTVEEQERMAARLSDPRGRGGLPDDWGEEPQA
nr:MAG TPA: Regulatory protein-modification, helix-turn-helix, transcriptional regulato, DNA [Caudoviricetes sp.]